MSKFKVIADKTFLEGNLKGSTVDWHITVVSCPNTIVKHLAEMSKNGDLRDLITRDKFILSEFKIEQV